MVLNSNNFSEKGKNRFFNKVHKTESCWIWTAGCFKDGYGGFGLKVNGKTSMYRAHRISYEYHNEPIPEGLIVCHTCDNRKCVNPSHLFLGTVKENALDMAKKERSTIREKNPMAKLTIEDVMKIRKQYAKGGITQKELGKKFGVGHTTISSIVNRINWSSIEPTGDGLKL